MSKQSMMGDGNKPGTRPGTRRNSVTASGFGSNAGSLLWAARNSIAFQTGKGGFKVPDFFVKLIFNSASLFCIF